MTEAPNDSFAVLTTHGGKETVLVDLRLVAAIESCGSYSRVHFNGSWVAVETEKHAGLVDRWVAARDSAIYVASFG